MLLTILGVLQAMDNAIAHSQRTLRSIIMGILIALISPYFRRWYGRADRRWKLTVNLLGFGFAIWMIAMYNLKFDILHAEPPHAGYWLLLIFIYAIPTFLAAYTAVEIGKLLRDESDEG